MPRDGRETIDHPRKLSHRRRERELLALASRQGGVVSLHQLLGLGFSPQEVHYRVARGRLHRLYRGVYAVGRADVPAKGHRFAAVLACGEGAVLSHLSAALHHGLRESVPARTDVTVPRRSHRRHHGIRVHRSLTLTSADATLIDDVPCTSVARTLLDIAAVLPLRPLERAVERANILEVYDHRAVIDVLVRHPRRSGSRRLRDALGMGRPGETITKSGLEEAMLALCRRHGLPEPEVNAWLLLGGEHHEVDFVWRAQKVAMEIDSWKYHRTRGAFARDRRRDQLLEVHGWQHARFTDDEVVIEQRHVAATAKQLLGL